MQFRTGQREALLMIIVREHSESLSPSALMFSAKRLQTLSPYNISENNVFWKVKNVFLQVKKTAISV